MAAVVGVVWLNRPPSSSLAPCASKSGRAAPHKAGGAAFQETFATLFAIEMQLLLNLSNEGPLPPKDAPHNLDEIINTVQSQGVNILFVSFRWMDQEPAPGAFDFRVMDYVQQAVCSSGLQLIVILDARASPAWVFDQHPDAGLVDADGDVRKEISFSHGGAMQLLHAWHEAVLARLAAVNASCVHSVSPTFNNQYETKYTQERDAFQDYSPNTVALYRQYLRSIHGGIAHWNTRWGTKFADWASFRPPPLHMHGPRWNDTLTDPSYWDWQHFRHHHIHAAHEHCCQHFAAHGFRCIMHFGEFFSANDAIYASGSVFTLAASPWLDYIVVDSNFVTAAMLPNDPRVVQLLLSAMKPFGKPVFFEGAFEEIKDPLVHRRAVQLTVASGAHGIGFTNWLDRVGPTFFKDTLSGLSHISSAGPSVAILTPYRSSCAFKGLGYTADGKRDPRDPVQDDLFACLDQVQKAVLSLGGLQIFGVPSMLLPVVHHFEQIWYLEPLVLLSGDERTISRIQQRVVDLRVPFHSCLANRPQQQLVAECCPSL